MVTATVGGVSIALAIIAEVMGRIGVLGKLAAKAHLGSIQLVALLAGSTVLVASPPGMWIQARLTSLFGMAGVWVAAVQLLVAVLGVLFVIAGVMRNTADGKTRAAAILTPVLAVLAPGGVGETLGEGLGMLAEVAAWVSRGLTGIG